MIGRMMTLAAVAFDTALATGTRARRTSEAHNAAAYAAVTTEPLSEAIAIPRDTRSEPAVPKTPLRQRLRRPLLFLFPIVLAAVGAAYYLAEEPYVSTDDAFVRAAKESVNARVAGQAVEIAVTDNQRVRRGQVLFQIDPEPYQIAVDQAEARLGSARLQIEALKATYRQQQAELQSAKDIG